VGRSKDSTAIREAPNDRHPRPEQGHDRRIEGPWLHRAFDRAEKKHGFSTGMRTKADGSGLVMVSATFYPKVRFHIQDVVQVSPTYVYGPHRDLTQEEWNATRDFLL
jgi:hypothetical protein